MRKSGRRQAKKQVNDLLSVVNHQSVEIAQLRHMVREIRVDPPGARLELHLNVQLTIGERQSTDMRVYPDIASIIGHEVLDRLRKTDKNHHQLQYEWHNYLRRRYASTHGNYIYEMMQKPFGYEDWELVPIPEGKKVE